MKKQIINQKQLGCVLKAKGCKNFIKINPNDPENTDHYCDFGYCLPGF